MTRIPLTEKLIISFMLLSMGAIGVVGIYSYYSARKAQMSRTYDQLASVRYLKQKEVEAFYHERIREIESLAFNLTALDIHTPNPRSPAFEKHFISSLSAVFPANKYYADICLLSNAKITSYQTQSGSWVKKVPGDNEKQLDLLLKINPVINKPLISDLKWNNERNEWVQYIVIPVPQSDSTLPLAITAELRSGALDSLMTDRSPLNGLGNSGECYLVGKDRYLRTGSRFLSNSVLSTRIDSSTTRLAFSGDDGTYLMNDYRGIEVLGSFSQLRSPCPGWAVIAEIDLKEAMVPIYTIRNNVIFITVFIAVIVFFVTWWLSKKITMPLIRLRKAAQELGKGNLGTQVAVTTKDEIGDLAKSFNLMSDKLKLKDTELQEEKARRMRAAFDGQDMERHRLSRELHDGLGQSLIAQKLRLESIQANDYPQTLAILGELKTCSDQLVDEVRRISNALMPAQLTKFGLNSALRQHCEEVSKYSEVEVTFDSTGNFDTIGRKTKTYIFRIVQEALNNIIKHSGATAATVEIAQTKENIFLSISDNGKGFNSEKACHGNGLNNMHERTILLQGTFSIQSHPNNGTTIEIQIPYKG